MIESRSAWRSIPVASAATFQSMPESALAIATSRDTRASLTVRARRWSAAAVHSLRIASATITGLPEILHHRFHPWAWQRVRSRGGEANANDGVLRVPTDQRSSLKLIDHPGQTRSRIKIGAAVLADGHHPSEEMPEPLSAPRNCSLSPRQRTRRRARPQGFRRPTPE